MPDDNETGPDETPTTENLPTGLPSFEQFPDEILSKWVALPADGPIAVPLTKKDIDNLLFALLRTNDAHLAIDQTLVKWSTGDLNGANLHLAEFRRLTIESQNRTRRFFAAIMRHATREL